MQYSNLLILAAVAGFTIYLGLPAAILTTRPKMRAFLNAFSAGVLIFLFVEITHKTLEMVEESAKGYFTGSPTALPVILGSILAAGFSSGLYGLTMLEEHFIGLAKKEEDPGVRSKRLSMMIAMAIGLHNFGEGLAIGQEYVAGSISLAYLLIAGFALHNATEGFGIAAPLQAQKVDWRFLALVGFIGGAPTFFGAIAGSFYTSPELELLALSIAAGGILYVIGELMQIGKSLGKRRVAMTGILLGFFIAFGSEMFIEVGTAAQSNRQAATVVFHANTSEYFFTPSYFSAREGDTVRFEVANHGKEKHEFELPQLKAEIELAPGAKSTLTIPNVRAGIYELICEMKGHAEKGMRGVMVVKAR